MYTYVYYFQLLERAVLIPRNVAKVHILPIVCPADGDPVQAGHDNWLGFVASMAAIHAPDFLGGISR